MLYKDLKQALLEYMEHGVHISLKSLINSILLCDNVLNIRLTEGGFSYESFNEISTRAAQYMPSYIKDNNNKAIFNNRILIVYDKNDRILDEIWFGKVNLLSQEYNRDRYGNDISDVCNALSINWKQDVIYIITVGDTLVDSTVIFSAN